MYDRLCVRQSGCARYVTRGYCWPLRAIRELMATGKMEPIIARILRKLAGIQEEAKKAEKKKKKRKSKEASTPKGAAAKGHEAQKKAKQERPEGAAGASNRGNARSRTSRSKAVSGIPPSPLNQHRHRGDMPFVQQQEKAWEADKLRNLSLGMPRKRTVNFLKEYVRGREPGGRVRVRNRSRR